MALSHTTTEPYGLTDLFDMASRLCDETSRNLLPQKTDDIENEWNAKKSLAISNLEQLIDSVTRFNEFIVQIFSRNSQVVLLRLETGNIIPDKIHYSETAIILLKKDRRTNKYFIEIKSANTDKTLNISEFSTEAQKEIFRFFHQWSNPLKVFSLFLSLFSKETK
jgi:hypothetical protein